MTTFFDLLSTQQQADVGTLGIDFNAQVGQLVSQNSNTAANQIAKQKLDLQSKITTVLPNITLTQETNLHNYLLTLTGLVPSTTLFQQLTVAQLQQVLTLLTT